MNRGGGVVLLIFFIISFNCVHCVRTCYRHLACLETNGSWFSSNRPFNPTPNTREMINTTFKMYTVATRRDGEDVYTDFETFKTKSFFKNATWNYFIIHGFRSWAKAEWIMEIKNEFLRIFGNSANVFTVDWSGHWLDYAQTAVNARVVGLEAAKFIDKVLLQQLGESPERVHLIGHSLGAHVAGYIGERIPGIGRITGLDPAGPHFNGLPTYVRLDPSDANFVDVIHTDTQGYGTNRPMGHVDFFANGEGEQPGCGALNMFPQIWTQGVDATLRETGTCAHGRSHAYFLESLRVLARAGPACRLTAYQCESYQDLKEGKCINNCHPDVDDHCMHVGLAARPIKGKKNVQMYFKTGSYRPFCLTPYRTYIDVQFTSVPVMYTVVFLTVYDSKGLATNWVFNDGYPTALHSRMIMTSLMFSPAVLTASEINTVSFHWNSRFYPFGLIRRALVNGFIRVKSISVTTIDGERVKLCPRGEKIDIYEYEEVVFHESACQEFNATKNITADAISINRNRNPSSTTETTTKMTTSDNSTKQETTLETVNVTETIPTVAPTVL